MCGAKNLKVLQPKTIYVNIIKRQLKDSQEANSGNIDNYCKCVDTVIEHIIIFEYQKQHS